MLERKYDWRMCWYAGMDKMKLHQMKVMVELWLGMFHGHYKNVKRKKGSKKRGMNAIPTYWQERLAISWNAKLNVFEALYLAQIIVYWCLKDLCVFFSINFDCEIIIVVSSISNLTFFSTEITCTEDNWSVPGFVCMVTVSNIDWQQDSDMSWWDLG